MEGLHAAGVSEEIVAGVQGDLSDLPVPEQDRALLRMAEALTLDPASASEAVTIAVSAGCSDGEVANAVFIVSHFNMVTRIAEAFALPPDETHPFDPDAGLPLLRCP